MKLIQVWIVEGDFGNVGGGKVLGIFKDKAVAKENSKGCGSLDCGGDGRVVEGLAFEEAGEYFLVDKKAYKLNEMKESEAKKIHNPKLDSSYFSVDELLKIKVKEMIESGQSKAECIKLIKEIGQNMDFANAMKFYDKCNGSK